MCKEERIGKILGDEWEIEKCFAFVLPDDRLYDTLRRPTAFIELTDLSNSTATTIAPKGREERKKDTCPRGLDDQKKG